MIITARISTVCPECRMRIAVGERVEWEKGKRAVHVECPDNPIAEAEADYPYMDEMDYPFFHDDW